MTSLDDAARMCGLSADDVMNITKNNETPLEKEAGEIWRHLDHLAATDPAGYRKYIDQQLKEGKEYMEKHGTDPPPKPKPNVPKPVFWVETEVLDGNGRGTGIPRYFNVCESDAIEYTDDKNLNIFMSELDNRQIDCVIHPKFMDRCRDDNLFMHDTVQLIFQTYTADHKEKENVRHTYKHHKEPRKLVMKVPKLQGDASQKEANGALEMLKKVRHHEEARKLFEDDRQDVAKRLFTMYKKDEDQDRRQPSPAPDPDTTVDPLPTKKAPVIEEVPCVLHPTVTREETQTVVCIPVPAGLVASDFDIELEEPVGGTPCLVVSAQGHEVATIPVTHPSNPSSYTAKFIRSKNTLKLTVK